MSHILISPLAVYAEAAAHEYGRGVTVPADADLVKWLPEIRTPPKAMDDTEMPAA